MFDRNHPKPAIRCYAEINPRYIGLYVVCYERHGRFVGADWCVVDDFGNLIPVL